MAKKLTIEQVRAFAKAIREKFPVLEPHNSKQEKEFNQFVSELEEQMGFTYDTFIHNTDLTDDTQCEFVKGAPNW